MDSIRHRPTLHVPAGAHATSGSTGERTATVSADQHLPCAQISDGALQALRGKDHKALPSSNAHSVRLR